ncbi:hypothetical protein GCM10025866_04490 [Naasia aerilata]|uniref:Uncharacterized protein n=1 Tax=Naasia aerilata TaxID=1162966 RepID=A0ABN6XI80_9MICO|nr:hypothetical protein GCM10025866_04490 [Naasia aerilata]
MPNAPETGRRGGLTPATAVVIEPQPWGRLEWMVSDAIGNSDVLTVGKCFIQPGEAIPCTTTRTATRCCT